MSRGLNKIQLIGRLGRDPEMRYTAQGKAVTNFSVATGGKWTDRDGNERDDTEWFRVEAWDGLGETCNKYLTKGTQVYIEGRIKTRKYTGNDGIERTAVDVVASNMIILSSKNNNGYQNDEEMADEVEAEPAPTSGRRPVNSTPAAAPRSVPASPARSAARPASRNQPQTIESDDDIPF